MKELVSVGQSDFRNLPRAGAHYVDKSLFVARVMASLPTVTLITRPRRFGKTCALSTCRYFLERSPEDRSSLFSDLKVWSDAGALEHFGRYPVCFLSLKDVKAHDWPTAFAQIRGAIAVGVWECQALSGQGPTGPWPLGSASQRDPWRGRVGVRSSVAHS